MTPGISQTFLFADLAGFTALTEAHGDEKAADVVGEFADLSDQLLAGHDCERVKVLGDAILFHSTDPAFAVRLGLRLSERVRAVSRMPELRVGIHTGSAISRGGDWYGSAVNLAARVTSAAGGGEVLLTEVTRLEAGELPEVRLQALGPQSFRNVTERVPLYRAFTSRESPPRSVDPVCRMSIDPARQVVSLIWEGDTIHFCSLECASQFAAQPGRFTEPDQASRA